MVQQKGDWVGLQPARSLLAVPNVTVHPSVASVPITTLLYNGLLLCGFNVGIKRLTVRENFKQLTSFSNVRYLKKRWRVAEQ